MQTGGHHEFTVNGKLDTKVGTHIKEVTTVYQIDASDLFKAKGCTITIDGAGITLRVM